MTFRILLGDVLEQLRLLPDEYFDCVVTSPPYWGLRDYGAPGQLGLELTLGEHIDKLVLVFREIRRVLKKHGTVWLNYGDCYAASPNGKSAADYKADGTDDRTFRDKPFSTIGPIRTDNGKGGSIGVNRSFHDQMRPKAGAIGSGGYLKFKDLCMIPNRLAIALQDDGWWVRSEIIWQKPNPMPESVYDRPTQAHEKIWLLTKSEEYFYNHEAIREPVTGGAHARRARVSKKVPAGWDTTQGAHGSIHREGRNRPPGTGPKSVAGRNGVKANDSFQSSVVDLVDTRAARNVWTIAPRPFKEAHFATFPPELAQRCIKAGVPSTTCGLCREAREACGGMCNSLPRVPGRVLDPFGGAGTVALVAERLGVDSTIIELNPEYVAITERRLEQDRAARAAKVAAE